MAARGGSNSSGGVPSGRADAENELAARAMLSAVATCKAKIDRRTVVERLSERVGARQRRAQFQKQSKKEAKIGPLLTCWLKG